MSSDVGAFSCPRIIKEVDFQGLVWYNGSHNEGLGYGTNSAGRYDDTTRLWHAWLCAWLCVVALASWSIHVTNYGHQHASHVLAYYLWQEIHSILHNHTPLRESSQDFDFTTEQREGWAYDSK